MPAVQSPHLVIAFSSCSSDAWRSAMNALPAGSLKNLGKLLQGMKPVASDAGEALSLSPPHERVLARALRLVGAGPLVDGLLPWAAWQAGEAVETGASREATGKAWAFVTPCHWAMGREHATLTDPAALRLTLEESNTLRAAMQPYFDSEGITLHPASATAPEHWLAEGEVFRHLPTASLDRVLGRNVDPWLPDSSTAPSLRRLQNEMQMLLYTHPLNDERIARGQQPVNSFWLSGTGALPPARQTPTADIRVARNLAQGAFAEDWAAYTQAWDQLDTTAIAGLLARQNAGEAVRLTLCGERHARTFESAPRSLLTQISSLLRPQPALRLLEQL